MAPWSASAASALCGSAGGLLFWRRPRARRRKQEADRQEAGEQGRQRQKVFFFTMGEGGEADQ